MPIDHPPILLSGGTYRIENDLLYIPRGTRINTRRLDGKLRGARETGARSDHQSKPHTALARRACTIVRARTRGEKVADRFPRAA
ncbi:hypothetical protein TSAR_014672 [Trichomalopsis sarcophagae]|uniref:Uncharacterized protein n=1 Tax=Trichomalopsis sarcophagae TaxID=543379 RepID=A0A232FHB7_9HYME|nr:hypothetical protein TSAR_014672 [Trichomalopsis sarcophagae]